MSSPPLQQFAQGQPGEPGPGRWWRARTSSAGKEEGKGEVALQTEKAPLECLHHSPGASLPVLRGPYGCPGSGEQGAAAAPPGRPGGRPARRPAPTGSPGKGSRDQSAGGVSE